MRKCPRCNRHVSGHTVCIHCHRDPTPEQIEARKRELPPRSHKEDVVPPVTVPVIPTAAIDWNAAHEIQ